MRRPGYHTFPFSALLGQEELCRALLANAVDPRCCGVLVRGEKGTAKSTAARALAELLPNIKTRFGCSCNCAPGEWICPDCRENPQAQMSLRPAPFVDLPLNATEDRVAGSLDFEHAVRHGVVRFTPGLLARAHRGVLYVDEVNLLDHHLAALTLDAVASGEHVVEREGVSMRHPARFILIGTMNPEEGPLGPQITDRFGLCVDVSGMTDPGLRVELLRITLARESDPEAFVRQWAMNQEALRVRLEVARAALPDVKFPEELLSRLAGLAQQACVQGQRAELVMRRAAMALAALDGKSCVDTEAVDEAALLALRHRKREIPPEPQHPPQPDAAPSDEVPPQPEQDRLPPPEPPSSDQHPPEGSDGEEQPRPSGASPQDKIFAPGQAFDVVRIEPRKDRLERTGRGKRSRSRTAMCSGRYVRSGPDQGRGDLALDATLRAAAPHQIRRRKEMEGEGPVVQLRPSDVREKVRERRMGALMLLVVDASGSMGAQKRMEEAKGAVLSLLQDAYRKRDRVGFIAFCKDRAELLLPPTSSPDLALKMLDELPTGGRTPLAHGLALAYETAERELRRNPSTMPLLVFVTDGRANVPLSGDAKSGSPLEDVERLADGLARDGRMNSLVVDMESDGFVSLGLAVRLARILGAEHHRMDTLRRDNLVRVVTGVGLP